MKLFRVHVDKTGDIVRYHSVITDIILRLKRQVTVACMSGT